MRIFEISRQVCRLVIELTDVVICRAQLQLRFAECLCIDRFQIVAMVRCAHQIIAAEVDACIGINHIGVVGRIKVGIARIDLKFWRQNRRGFNFEALDRATRSVLNDGR